MTRAPGRLAAVLENSAWLVLDKLLRVAVWIALGGIIARHLGQEGLGQYGFVMALLMVAGTISTLGIEPIAIQSIVQQPDRIPRVLGTAFFVRLIGGFAGIAVCVGLASVLRPSDAEVQLLSLIAALALPFRAAEVVEYVYAAQIRSRTVVFVKDAAFLVSAAGGIVAVLLGFGIAAVLAMAAFEAAAAAAGLLLLALKSGMNPTIWRFDRGASAELAVKAAPLALADVLVVLNMRLDQYLIVELAGFAVAGTYYAASRAVEVSYLIPMAVASSVYPILVGASDAKSAESHSTRLYAWSIWGGVGVAIALMVLAEPLVLLVYGSRFEESIEVMRYQAWLAPIVFFNTMRSRALQARGRLREVLLIQVAALPLGTVACLILIPLHGAVGASWAILIMAIGSNLVVGAFSPVIRDTLRQFVEAFFVPFSAGAAILMRKRFIK